MGTYTVLQDIEAEDKLLGPLTMRQFIYAGITVGCGFLAFMAGKVLIFLAIPFVLPMLVFGFLAAPWGKDQPTETWAVAKVRFFFKPRKRIWNQTGQKDLVEITVPKVDTVQYTDGLSQHEVRSRLQALATTIDTRGWVIKNNVGAAPMPQQPVIFSNNPGSDRLTGATAAPQIIPDFSAGAVDVLDEQTGVAQHFDQMIAQSERTHRQQLLAKLNSADTPQSTPQSQAAPQQAWFNPNPVPQPQQITQQPTVDEATLLADLQAKEELSQHYSNSHLKTIQPLGATPPNPQQPASTTPQTEAVMTPQPVPSLQDEHTKTPVTPEPDPAILELSRNDDLSVATIARQAKKKPLEDEVVISLH